MSDIIKPVIGRKVWYRHDGNAIDAAAPSPWTPTSYSNQPMDATIIYVWGDRMVNLRVTDHAGATFTMRSVTLVQEGDLNRPTGRYCEWMPYQVATNKQALRVTVSKTEDQVGLARTATLVTSAAGFSLDSDKPLTGACDLSGEGSCEACQ